MALNRYRPFFAGFDDFFLPPPAFFHPDPVFDDDLMPVVPKLIRDETMVLRRASPGYEINEDKTKFQLAVDVPDLKGSDMKLELEHGGRVLHLSGERRVVSEDENSVSETKFDKRFSIGENVDTTKLTANLKDGVLVVNAPKKEEDQMLVQTIPITEHVKPALEGEQKMEE